jgi:hypothetical protein
MLKKALLAAIGFLVLSLVWVGFFGAPGPGAVEPVSEKESKQSQPKQQEPAQENSGGSGTYKVVEVQENAVDEAGVTYDGVRVVTRMDVVDEGELKFVASDLAHNHEDFKDRTDVVVLFVQNEDGTSSRSAFVDFGDDTVTEF